MKKFTFIHIPRTGGTILTKTLRPYSDSLSFSDHQPANKMTTIDRFSFSIVRNPYARQISLYKLIKSDRAHHLHKQVELLSFHDYICDLLPNISLLRMQQREFICNDEIISVDFVGRFETLAKDFLIVCDRIGITQDIIILPFKDYRSYYKNDMVRVVNSLFEDDLKIFGYKF